MSSHRPAWGARQSFAPSSLISPQIVHGQIAFEGHTTKELSGHELVKQYYLGV